MRCMSIALMLSVITDTFGAESASHPPVAPVRPVTENYFGTTVVDPYRWMEDRSSPERVAPWQAGKMAARLQAATSSGRPVLLLVDPDAGHGIGSTKLQRDRETAAQLAFFYWAIGW